MATVARTSVAAACSAAPAQRQRTSSALRAHGATPARAAAVRMASRSSASLSLAATITHRRAQHAVAARRSVTTRAAGSPPCVCVSGGWGTRATPSHTPPVKLSSVALNVPRLARSIFALASLSSETLSLVPPALCRRRRLCALLPLRALRELRLVQQVRAQLAQHLTQQVGPRRVVADT